MAKLSVVIPSRDERFLLPTVHDLFRNAQGEFEVIAVLDSDKWPEGWKEITDQYPNLHTIHNGRSLGMRASINRGVASATSRGAKYVAKTDGHCAFGEGFDEILKADLDDDWIVIPRRKRLDAENWTLTETHKPDIDYHYLSFPDNPDDWGGAGLNGKVWEQRARERKDKPEYDIDDECSSQGSFWCMRADYFERMGFMDEASYGPFWNEMQELALCCWLSGGQVKINKKTWYAHLHKGKKYGRGYHLPEAWLQKGRNHTMLWPWNEAFSKQTLPFKWLIERFHPMPSWPDNWEEILYATRKPRLVSVVGSNTGTAGDIGDNRKDVPGVSLSIHWAYYGVGDLSLLDVSNFVDVTNRLQSLVKNNSLDIVVNNSTLTPDHNPFRGKKKKLRMAYSIDGGELVTIEREEKDWLIIGPVRDSNVPATVEGSSEGVRLTIKSEEQPGLATATLSGEDDLRPVDTLRHLSSYSGNRSVDAVIELGPIRTAAALNDYLIRRFSISPQRLRGPMPIELRDFHRNDLAQLFAELGFKRGAEIGVAEGNYSEVLLKANPECELLLVDPWHAYAGNPQNKSNDKHEFAYNEVVRKTKDYPHVDIRQGYSMDVVDGIMLNELDFVYIDACHLFDDCVMDIIEWSKRVRSGGIVSGDDYYALDQKRWVGGGVVEAVQAYVNAHRIPVWWIFQGHKSTDFMWVKP